jgi:hypothetical protein
MAIALGTIVLLAGVCAYAQQETTTAESAPAATSTQESQPADSSPPADTQSASTDKTTPAPDAQPQPAENSGSSDSATPAQGADSPQPAPDTSSDAKSNGGIENHGIFNAVVYRPLWALTRGIGDFNPIGKGISTPLEEKFPGFRFKGFINNITQVNTTADTQSAAGIRTKDWRIQKQEERVQLEFKYQANEHLEFVSVNNFLWDGAYALSNGKGLAANGNYSNQEYYTQGKRIFREAYLRGNYRLINFTVGRQIINWGKMDGKVIDFVNGYDYRDQVDGHAGDYEWRSIGQFMAYASLRPTGTTSVSLLWNPDFQPMPWAPKGGAAPGSPWSLSNPTTAKTTPEVRPSGFNKLSESEAGVRVNQTIRSLTASVIYYYGFTRPDFNGTQGVLFSSDKKWHYTRENIYGYALDYAFKLGPQNIVYRGEGIYTQGQPYSTTANLPNGVVKKDWFEIANAIETKFGNNDNQWDVLYQPIWGRVAGVDGAHTTNVIRHVLDASHSVRATDDKLGLEAAFYVDKGGSRYGGWSSKYSGSWHFTDNLRGIVSFTDYQGFDNLTKAHYDSPWGLFSKWKNVTIDLKYEW